tara:strand:- start:324 stop:830 length:507 start_codon:yes stop_codon:yes gene_type:complete
MYVVDLGKFIWGNNPHTWEQEGLDWGLSQSFENVQYDRVIDSINTLLSDEFKIPVRYDQHVPPQSFLILPQSDELVEQLSGGQSREYNILISYQLKSGGRYGRHTFKQLSQKAEHVKRLIINNSAYTSSGSYKWHSGNIVSVEHERDEDDASLLRALMTFNCVVTEVI